jgi:hypothetical protein
MPIKSVTTNSPSLPELQRWMRRVLTHHGGVECALHHPGGPRLLHVIGETPELSRIDRLAIYGNGYFWRLIDCLGANYDVMKKHLGEDLFAELSRDYLDKHPSHFKCIDDVGAHLAEFIKTHHVSKKRPYLSELAQLEWAVHQSMYADDVPPLDPKTLSRMSADQWKTAKIILDPSVRLLKLNWALDDLWRDGKWRKNRKKIVLLVYRRDDKLVRIPRLSAGQHKLLESLGRGKNLSQSLTPLSRKDSTHVQQWFNDWVGRGVIRGFEFRPAGVSSRRPSY